MFPRGSRLPHRDFSGRPVRRAKFAFGSVSYYSVKPPRVAVVVSKKVARRAVDRNRIRRRVLHALRALSGCLTASMVVYPSKEALTALFPALKAALEEVVHSR